MFTVLRIGTTDYDHTGNATGRAVAGIYDMRLQLTIEMGYGNAFTFNVDRCGADAPFVPGVPITVTTDTDGLVFSGDLDDPQMVRSETGYTWAYTCTDLKHRANRVTIAGLDGSATARFNLTPDDYLYLYATAGQTVGQIVSAVLTAATNAAALAALGVGAFATMSPPTLPSLTIGDLSALAIVPPEPVLLQGEGILNTLEQFILRWHPQHALWVEADGTIRVKSIFAFTPQSFTVPHNATAGDDIDWPTYNISCKECYTAVSVRGLSIDRAECSFKEGTLVAGWTAANQAAWTIDDFLQPRDGSDDGDLSFVTSSNCTVKSDYAGAHWPANFWNGDRGGWIQFIWRAGTGIEVHAERQITSCTSLAPGGTALIGWDASLPLDHTNYDRYHIRGLNSPLAVVDRKFYPSEPGLTVAAVTGPPAVPAHPAQGMETWVGSHMYPRFPKGTYLANNSSVETVFYPAAQVYWSRTGDYPWFVVPIKCQLNPKEGSITLTEPAVSKFGDPVILEGGYPTSFADGLWSDVRVVFPYNRGDLAARSPSSGFSGTAYTKYGIEREKVIRYDALVWAGDVAAFVQLAAEHLAVLQDAVIQGSVVHHEMPADFSAFKMGYALQFTFPAGVTTRIDGETLPVRTTTIHWPEQGELHRVTFEFSNMRRAFEGDSLYIHPGFSGETFGTQDGGVWVGGNVNGFSGSADPGEWNSTMKEAGEFTPQQTPLSQATSHNQLAANMGLDPAGMTPEKAREIGKGNITGVERPNTPFSQGANPLGDAIAGNNQPDGSGLSLDPSQFDISGLGRKSGGRSGESNTRSEAEEATGDRRKAREKAEDAPARANDARKKERLAGQDQASKSAIDRRKEDQAGARANAKAARDANKPLGPGASMEDFMARKASRMNQADNPAEFQEKPRDPNDGTVPGEGLDFAPPPAFSNEPDLDKKQGEIGGLD